MFIRTNIALTSVWGLIFTVNTILAWGKMEQFVLPDLAYEITSYTLLVGTAVFTNWSLRPMGKERARLQPLFAGRPPGSTFHFGVQPRRRSSAAELRNRCQPGAYFATRVPCRRLRRHHLPDGMRAISTIPPASAPWLRPRWNIPWHWDAARRA